MIRVYKNNQWRPLAGQKIRVGGQWKTLKDIDRFYLNGTGHYLGEFNISVNCPFRPELSGYYGKYNEFALKQVDGPGLLAWGFGWHSMLAAGEPFATFYLEVYAFTVLTVAGDISSVDYTHVPVTTVSNNQSDPPHWWENPGVEASRIFEQIVKYEWFINRLRMTTFSLGTTVTVG